MRLLFVECGASEEWDEFVNNVLQPILDMQSNFQVELDGNQVCLINPSLHRRCNNSCHVNIFQEDFKTHFFETHVDADLPAFGTFAVSTKQVNIGESIWSRSQVTKFLTTIN